MAQGEELRAQCGILGAGYWLVGFWVDAGCRAASRSKDPDLPGQPAYYVYPSLVLSRVKSITDF